MTRILGLLFAAVIGLSACTDGTYTTSEGARLYRLSGKNPSKVQFNMLDSVNALRQAHGAGPVELDAKLNAAAATHARDMSIQNRPWHFGSDGSSPLERVARVGYQGKLSGENISETYETELETLGAWMQEEGTQQVILDPAAAHMGFAWFQEPNGKIWWTLVMGAPANTPSELADLQG